MSIVIIGDLHILDKNLEEVNTVLNEIEGHIEPEDTVVQLGDWYHNKRPTATELKFGTEWATRFANISETFYMVRGNHPMVSYK